jgi:hypothetical protein
MSPRGAATTTTAVAPPAMAPGTSTSARRERLRRRAVVVRGRSPRVTVWRERPGPGARPMAAGSGQESEVRRRDWITIPPRGWIKSKPPPKSMNL